MRNEKSEIRNKKFMRMAIALARRGIGRTSPNPAVGAVIVSNGKIVGRGYHKKAGLPHAEVNALREAGKSANGADMYVTLEPCSHFGKTPPCTDAVISARIKRVFVGMKDPNPCVAGGGIKRLRYAGVGVFTGILEKECRTVNEAYVKYITKRMPFVTLKLASTLDGKIAAAGGESRWITDRAARRLVHRMRARTDAVMVGIETILKDDPELTVRLVRGMNPARVVADSRLKIPAHAKVLRNKAGAVIVATTRQARASKIEEISNRGAEVILLPSRNGKVDLKMLMKELAKRGIASLIIEGGSVLAASALRDGIVDRVAIFCAPKILGKEGLPMIGELGIKGLKDTISLYNLKCTKVGEDILVEGCIEKVRSEKSRVRS